MIYRFLLSAFLFFGAFLSSFANNPNDSLPAIDPDYKGYRLAITDLILSEQEDKTVNVSFTIINTGREDIAWDENDFANEIILNFDISQSDQVFEQYKTSFSHSLFTIPLKIKAGEIIHNCEIILQVTGKNDGLAAEVGELKEQDPSTTSATAKGEITASSDENLCSDLVIESISIVKKSNNYVTLKYKIKNNGKEPALISGGSKKTEDNLAMTFHMSSSEKLTRGAIPIGGAFVKDGRQIPDGKLYPGKSLTDEVKLDIRNMTRFTPIIIIEIDPYLSVQECDETNNQNYIKVKK